MIATTDTAFHAQHEHISIVERSLGQIVVAQSILEYMNANGTAKALHASLVSIVGSLSSVAKANAEAAAAVKTSQEDEAE